MAAESSSEEILLDKSRTIHPASNLLNGKCLKDPDPPYLDIGKFKRGLKLNLFKSTFNRFRKKYGVDVAAILEPRVSVNKALSIIRSLGFTSYIIADAHGYAGGVWVAWDPNDVNISLIRKQDQFIHCWVEFPGKEGFCSTVVYASPQEEKRRVLWEDLKHVGRSMNDPWMLSGDFNEISSVSEKRGGGPVDVNRCNRFNNVLDACGVMDLGGGGNRFTWKGPKFLHLDMVCKRLDKAVANDLWRACFDEADVLILPRIFSDHCPVLVRLEKEETSWRERPFRFIATWQNDPRKNMVIARLEGIQRQLSLNNNYQLEKLEAKFRKELSDILDQEEHIWYQKSRGEWIKGGDRNTGFYHTSTLIRRKRN
ncbi:uncharacterized protein LOC133309117 [Gastrolobium bilobum]|uniref:uncharacterized protein LOC133309117 n=1 Tax=Gastrolobium bilobum TaxID=150636 RepID=UPI002AB295B2|nr:uncharacterized protein LOC133309117 [Gastrolobium bilobum]